MTLLLSKRATQAEPMPLMLAEPSILWLWSYLMWERSARAAHADDREYEEMVDLGGEA